MNTRTTRGVAIGATIVVTLFGALDAISARQTPIVQAADEKALREYTGVYRYHPASRGVATDDMAAEQPPLAAETLAGLLQE